MNTSTNDPLGGTLESEPIPRIEYFYHRADTRLSQTRVALYFAQASGADYTELAEEYTDLHEAIHEFWDEEVANLHPSLEQVLAANLNRLREGWARTLAEVAGKDRSELTLEELDRARDAAQRLAAVEAEAGNEATAREAARTGARLGHAECGEKLYFQSRAHETEDALRDFRAIYEGGLEDQIYDSADLLGDCEAAVGEREAAKEAYRRSIALNSPPDCLYSAVSLAALELEDGDPEAAHRHHRWVLDRAGGLLWDRQLPFTELLTPLLESPDENIRNEAGVLLSEFREPWCPACGLRLGKIEESEDHFGLVNRCCNRPEGCGNTMFVDVDAPHGRRYELVVRSVGEFLTLTHSKCQADVAGWFDGASGVDLDASIQVEAAPYELPEDPDEPFTEQMLQENDPNILMITRLGDRGWVNFDDGDTSIALLAGGIRQLQDEINAELEAAWADEDTE